MPEKITQAFIQKYPQVQKRVTIRDTTMHFLLLRIEPSGKKTFLLDYYLPDGKRNMKKIGDATIITPNQAREYAEKVIAEIKLNGTDITQKRVKTNGNTLRSLAEQYEQWVMVHRRRGTDTMMTINNTFAFLLDEKVGEITYAKIDGWRTEQRANGKKASSINRQLTALRGMFSWALEYEIIKENPFTSISRLKEPRAGKVRYLSKEERGRLMVVLENRNDYIRPLVILGLNTGIRKSAMLALEWVDINYKEKTILLRPEHDKTEDLYIVPMNTTIVSELKHWQKHCSSNLIFPSPRTGNKLDSIKKAWSSVLKEAQIENFRFHDLRHDFASQLVMKGVDLNTVRELLGHSDIKMTLRYAHLAPSKKSEAVEMLG